MTAPSGVAEAFSVGVAVASSWKDGGPASWPDQLGDGTLDPVMRVLAGAIPRHGRLVIADLPDGMVDGVLAAMADGPFTPSEVINAFYCVFSHQRFRDHDERFLSSHRPLRFLAQRVGWWSLHDLLFLSDDGTRLWADALDDAELGAVLAVVGGLLKRRVLDAIGSHRTARLRSMAVSAERGKEAAGQHLHHALVRVILAVERNEIDAPLPSLDRLVRSDMEAIAERPWPEGTRDDRLANTAEAIRLSLFGGDAP